jgi:predicted ATPase
MEETVQVLLDEGALVRDGAALRLTRALGELKIPPTVQAILAARIDRLAADQKDLLQTLAVIGREFSFGLLQRVVSKSQDDLKSEDELNRMLNALQLAEFIYEQPALDGIEYIFKHALTQEVAYQSLLVERRKRLHERIGNAIEVIFAGRLDDHLTELAHHYVRSGNADKATHSLMLAAQQAIWISAHDEALANVNLGLSLLENIADETIRARREADLEATLGYGVSRREPASAAAEAAYLRVRELCARLDDDNLLCSALGGLRLYYNFRAELDRALELATEMLKVAERARSSAMVCSAHNHLAQTLYFRGQLLAAQEHVEEAAPLMNQFLAYPNFTFLGDLEGRRLLILCLLGYPKQASPSAQPALAVSNTQTAFFRELFTTQIYYLLRDPRRCWAR